MHYAWLSTLEARTTSRESLITHMKTASASRCTITIVIATHASKANENPHSNASSCCNLSERKNHQVKHDTMNIRSAMETVMASSQSGNVCTRDAVTPFVPNEHNCAHGVECWTRHASCQIKQQLQFFTFCTEEHK